MSMCNRCGNRNPFHCIVPPYMVEKIESASTTKRSLFAGNVTTRFNDALFRKKRALLTEMNDKQMNTVLNNAFGEMVKGIAPAKKGRSPKSKSPRAPKPPTPNRTIYDAQNSDDQKDLPGRLVRKEGQRPVKDKDVNNIYDNCGYTWNFYYSQFKRVSIDGKNLPLINSVHFGNNFGNAFWEGTQMVYGDGDQVFKSFTTDIDITGHELTHGVVQYEANLEYIAQSGAINESMADVFGIMVRQFVLKEDAASSDWLIGRTCMKGSGYALRSMKAPGTAYKNHPVLGDDPQPGNMANYVQLPNTSRGDNGGVHINSGIPNHAFYLTAVQLGGQSWTKAGKIWYQALCDQTLLNSTSQFSDLANATTTKAGQLYGNNSLEAKAVKKSWRDVGL